MGTSVFATDAGLHGIVHGRGCVREHLVAALDEQGVGRPLLVCGAQVRRTPVFDLASDLLAGRTRGRPPLVFDGSLPHSPSDAIEAGAELARSEGVDGIVAIGGSSSIDTAKGIAVLCATGTERVADLAPPGPGALSAPMRAAAGVHRVPVLTATTTLSYAEFFPFWGTRRSDLGTKRGYGDHGAVRRTIFLDGELAAHTPDTVWFETAVKSLDDALLVHLRSAGPEPYLDPLLLTGIRGVLADLLASARAPGAATADPEARQRVLTAMALTKHPVPRLHGAITGDWFARAVRYALGSRHELSHGAGTCIALAEGLRFHRAHTLDRQRALLEALAPSGAPVAGDDPTGPLTARISETLAPLPLPRTLADVGLDASHVDDLADDIASSMPGLGGRDAVAAALVRLLG
jgi:alcohol dehydrogenase class IV